MTQVPRYSESKQVKFPDLFLIVDQFLIMCGNAQLDVGTSFFPTANLHFTLGRQADRASRIMHRCSA